MFSSSWDLRWLSFVSELHQLLLTHQTSPKFELCNPLQLQQNTNVQLRLGNGEGGEQQHRKHLRMLICLQGLCQVGSWHQPLLGSLIHCPFPNSKADSFFNHGCRHSSPRARSSSRAQSSSCVSTAVKMPQLQLCWQPGLPRQHKPTLPPQLGGFRDSGGRTVSLPWAE